MKYVFWMLLVAVVFVSCKKTNSSNTSILLYNATWSLPAITASWNSVDIVTTAIAQGKSSGTPDSPYVQVPAGTNLITLQAGTNKLLDKNIYTTAAAGSSFFVYDTSIATAASRILKLNDDLILPDTTQVKYRILDMAPDTSVRIDIWLVNGAADSIRLDSAAAFIGPAAIASSVELFSAITFHGGNYTVKAKKTGAQQVYASVANYPFSVKGIYSIVFSGLLTGTGSTGFKLSVLHHRPQ